MTAHEPRGMTLFGRECETAVVDGRQIVLCPFCGAWQLDTDVLESLEVLTEAWIPHAIPCYRLSRATA